MTNEEFSNEFDSLVNSFSTSENFGEQVSPLKFDEYEKSMFLTKAQENIVVSLYNGKLTGDSFEKTEQLRRYLNELVVTDTPTKTEGKGVTDHSVFYILPDDVWFITYESAKSKDVNLKCSKEVTLEVVPVTQDDFYRTVRNPFKKPNKRRALRLDTSDSIVELISDYSISEYLIRYIKKPSPIILSALPNGLTINNISEETECKLNPAIHRVILEMAVSLALKSRTSAGK
jgi:hypothetical protein